MNSRKITFILVAAFALLVIAGTKVSQLTRTRSIQSTSRFLVSTQDATTGRWSSRFIEAPDLATNLGPWITNSGSGASTLASYVVTNGETKNVLFNGGITMESVQTNNQIVYLNDDIIQSSGNTAEFPNLNASTTLTIAGQSYQTYINNASNDLYGFITAAGISASTATNIARYWATNAALQASNQLELVKAPKTNATLYGTVNINGGVANEILAYDASKNLSTVSGVTATEASFLDGLGENIQDALDARSTDALTNAATKDFGVANKVVYSKGLTPAAGWQYWDDFNTPMTTAGQFPDSPSGHRYTVLSTYGNTNQIVLTNGYWSMGNTGAIYMSITSQTNGVYGSIKPYNKWGGTFRYKRSTNNTTDGVDRNLTFILSTNADFITKPFLHVSIGINGFRVQKELSSTNIIYGYPYEGSRYLGFDTNYNFTLTIISNTLIAEIAGMTYMGTEPLLSTVYKDLRVATWESTGTHTNQHWGEWDAQYAGYASAQDFAMFGGPFTWATNFGLSSVTFADGTTQTTAYTGGGGGDVTTAQLLVVSNQVQAVTNVFRTDVGNLQGATNGITTRLTNIEGTTNLVQSRQGGNAHLTNLTGVAASTVTNENSAALQINTGTLTLTPGVLSNVVQSGFGAPYIAIGTNGGTLVNATNFMLRGLVASNDATGIMSIHAPASSGSASISTNGNQFGASVPITIKDGALMTNINVTGTLTTGNGSTSNALISLSSFQGDAFALTRATNSPASTGTTNDFQVSQSAKLGDTLTLLANTAGFTVWTNGNIVLTVTDTNQASINVDFSLPYTHYIVTTSRTNFDVAWSNTWNARVGRTIYVEFPTNLVTTSVQVTNKDAQTVRWNFGITTNGAPSIVKTNIRHLSIAITTPSTNHPVIDAANY